jgi:membrane fusion protein, heavy metal efflux system
VPAVPEVTVTKVQRGELREQLAVSGNLAALPNRDAKLAPLVPGRIARILVTEGDRVVAGQVLAELENSALRDQELQAEVAVKQAQTNVDNARIAVQREEDLLRRGIAARKEVEDARNQLAVAEATLAQARAALSMAHSQVARSAIRAPFAGTVVHRFLGVGEQVDGTSAQPVVEVADIDTLELLGAVPAARLSQIHANEGFDFETPSLPGVSLHAVIADVLPAVDPATNNGMVRIRIQNRGHQLKLGQFLSIALPLPNGGPRLVVPRQSLYPDESGTLRVYKVTGDEAQAVAVKIGVETADKAEILSGLNEGDTVIVTGGYGLPDHAKVHVK